MEWHVQPEINAFVDATQAFCHLVTTPTSHPSSWLPSLRATTLGLYAAGLVLPDVAVEHFNMDSEAAYRVSEEEWRTVWRGLGDRLAGQQWYRPLVPGITSPDDAGDVGIGDLADDLADIYRDLTPGLRYWQTGAEQGRVGIVWQWKQDFTLHWGNHAIAALSLLHYLVGTG